VTTVAGNLMLYPTFACFDDAMEFFNELASEGAEVSRLDEYRIVHGIVLTPDDEPYAHAWVEHDDPSNPLGKTVIQAGLVAPRASAHNERIWYQMPLAEFERRYRVQKRTAYTPRQASDENYRSGHLGPWLPEYAAACNDGPRKRIWWLR
jgi:hypothetical protein